MARLNRRFSNGDYPQDSTPFQPLSSCLSDYHSPALSHLCTHTYSKPEAIRQLAGHMPSRDDAAELVRALLTDRGLLFPQTRERFYIQTSRSWYRSTEFEGFYSRVLQDMGVSQDTPFPARALTFARQAYDRRDCSVSFDRMSQALEVMLQACQGEQFPQITACEDVGYCKGELGTLEQPSSPGTWTDASAAQAVMEAWLQTVQLSFDGRSTVSGWDYLRETLNFTVTEAFAFLSDILPLCINAEEYYQGCLAHLRPYEPVLYDHQKSQWQQQVRCFHEEDLSAWRKALPALEQYLNPDLSRFGRSACIDAGPNPEGAPYVTRLQAAFEAYLRQMEPKYKTDQLGTIAAYFVYSARGTDDESPLFMDMPSVIFHLFRSPYFRYFYNFEDRNYPLHKAVKNGFLRFPLPITPQSLDADEPLYLAIVDICEGYCRARNTAFDAASWRALWPCIRQCVTCLSFQKEDLFTVRYSLRDLMVYREKGFPFLDQLLSDRLEAAFASAYAQLWRTIFYKVSKGKITGWNSASGTSNNQHCQMGVNEKRLNQLLDTVSAYRSLLERPETDLEDVVRLLWPLCSKLSFNKISFVPSNAEWKILAEPWGVRPRSAHSPVHHIKTTRIDSSGCSHPQKGGKKTMDAPRTIELILAEWLMLQWSCTQAQRELMTVIAALLRD